MPCLTVDIALAKQSLERYYQGSVSRVIVQSREGGRVNLPIHHLRPFITHDGVQGAFEIEFSELGKLVKLRRIS